MNAKKSYLGLRPLDVNISRADKFMCEYEQIPALDYFAVLPAVLRAYTEDESRKYMSFELSNFMSFSIELDPGSAEVPRMKKMFKQLGYGQKQIEYIVLMLRQLRKQLGLEDYPYYEPDSLEKFIDHGLNSAIKCFGLVLWNKRTDY